SSPSTTRRGPGRPRVPSASAARATRSTRSSPPAATSWLGGRCRSTTSAAATPSSATTRCSSARATGSSSTVWRRTSCSSSLRTCAPTATATSSRTAPSTSVRISTGFRRSATRRRSTERGASTRPPPRPSREEASMKVGEVLEGGIQTTVQDYPGRRGMLAQGFFPAGPMDHFAFRAANLLVGNAESAAGRAGVEGRPLARGDRLPLGEAGGNGAPRRFRESVRPAYAREWEVRAMRGPQAAPDYLTEADMVTFFSRSWPIDRNSNRTGIRLESHKFEWARGGGGIAGGHPSNILDNSYPVGAVNVNGDLPVILAADGPP